MDEVAPPKIFNRKLLTRHMPLQANLYGRAVFGTGRLQHQALTVTICARSLSKFNLPH